MKNTFVKLAAFALVLLPVGIIQAQENPEKSETEIVIIKKDSLGNDVEIIIEQEGTIDRENARLIRREAQAVIKQKVRELRDEIDEIKAAHREGEISDEEMGEQIAEASERISKEIEAEARKLEESIRVETRSRGEGRRPGPPAPPRPPVTFEEDAETGEKKMKVKVKGKPKPAKRTTSGFALTFGWNTMLSDNEVEGVIYPEMEFWRGSYSEWGWVANTRIGARRSPIWLNYGLSLVYTKTDIGGNNRIYFTDNIPMFGDAGVNMQRSRFHNHYVNGTLGLKIAPKGTKGFHLEANGFAGVRFRTKQYLKYKTDFNEIVEEDRRANYGVNRFNYGVSAAVGYGFVSVYGRYDLSSLFENTSSYDLHPLSVGIRFNLL